MRRFRDPFFLLLLSLPLSTSARAAGGVVIVGQPGNVGYATVQDAVDAASDGDVLLVAAGSYPGFTIQDLSVSVFAAPGAQVTIQGAVEINDLAAHRVVVLAGLDVHATTPPTGTQPSPALSLAYDAGHVRVEDCLLQGDDARPNDPRGGAGVNLLNASRVVFVRSKLVGGSGRFVCSYSSTCAAAAGGPGLFARNSRMAVQDCQVLGGQAGYFEYCGGDGGNGMEVFNSETLLAGSTVRGANGEYECLFQPGTGGDGGNGLVILSGRVDALGSSLVAGVGQHGGVSGVALLNSGTYVLHPGSARSLTAETVLDDQSPNSISVTGVPGDSLWMPTGLAPDFHPGRFVGGWWLLPFPVQVPKMPITTLPGSGTLVLSLPTAQVPATLAGRVFYRQLFVRDALGAPWASAPLHQLVLNRDGQPDCNVNGVLDYLDVLADPSLDCNGNLVIDACELGSPSAPDCNTNGIPDQCDIAAGTSLDLNKDGIPDECQPAITLWVDATAAPGGNGSSGAPFQALGEALAAATPQHLLVVVRDGLYVGPLNRDLDFGGKPLVFKSESGPAACVVDLQGAGRLALLDSAEKDPAGFRGLTIRNGSAARGGAVYVSGAQLRLEDCVIESCAATGVDGGGAVFFSGGRVDIHGSELRGCTATFGAGGAVHQVGDGFLTVSTSTLVDNSAREGGAIAIELGIGRAIISHSRLLANTASAGGGGAIRAQKDVDDGYYQFLFTEDLLFAGNHAAGNGGALWLRGLTVGGQQTSVYLWESTLTANSAGNQGGAIFEGPDNHCYPYNSVLWGNVAPLGGQIALSSVGVGNRVSLISCDLEGGLAAIHNPGGYTTSQTWSIDLDPVFLDPDGPDNDPLTYEDNDYRLAPTSPCIDAGNSTFAHAALDLLGQPRRVDDPLVPDTGQGPPPIIDMGAYERQP